MLGKQGELNLSLPEMVDLGYFPGAERWNKFGAGIVGTTFNTVYSAGASPGLYNYLPKGVNKKLKLASTDIDDTSGGAGGSKIIIYGQDAEQNRFNEIVILNGQTPVETLKEYNYIYRMQNLSEEDVQGQVYAGPTDAVWVGGEPDHILGHINDGYNQSQMALYRVPKGYRLMIYNLILTSGNKEGEAGLYVRSGINPEGSLTCFANKVPYEINGVIPVNVQGIPFSLPYGAEFEIRAKSAVGTMRITANMSGVLMPERYFN